jgi:hypothetical protein
VIDAIYEARPPFDPDVITRQVAALLQSYGVSFVMGDSYAAQWPVTAFASYGITYQAAVLSKSGI